MHISRLDAKLRLPWSSAVMRDKIKNRRIGDLTLEQAGRPDPDALQPRQLSQQEWQRCAAKAARKVVQCRDAGNRRKLYGGYDWATPDMDALRAGLAKAPRCTAETKAGARCRLACVRGSDRCRNHEGVERAPWSAAAGRKYLKGALRQPRGRYKTHPSAKP